MNQLFRRATEAEIELAKKWVLANTPVHTKDFDPTGDPEYSRALEIIIFANGGRYADPDPDPMPVFPIKGKDRLAPDAIAAYSSLCLAAELHEQWVEVEAALAETIAWQERHADLVKTPSHKHVRAGMLPFGAAVDRYASNMRAAGLDVSVTQIAPGQIRVSGRVPGSEQDPTSST